MNHYTFNEEKHIHLLGGQPLYGTSTVVKDVMPPFLAKWGAQCAVDYISEHPETQWTNQKTFFESNSEVLESAVMAWNTVRKDAAQKGTNLHEFLEQLICVWLQKHGKPLSHSGNPALERFAEWAVGNVEHVIFAEKHTYSKSTWTGGIVDCLAKLKDGRLAVIDFKSSKEAYFNHFAQVAGYALQLEESGYGNADGANWQSLTEKISVLVVVPFGAKTLKPVVVENVDGFKDVFRHIVEIYKFLQAFKNK